MIPTDNTVREFLDTNLSDFLPSAIETLQQKVNELLADLNNDTMTEFHDWFVVNYNVTGSRTPKGQKELKSAAEFFVRYITPRHSYSSLFRPPQPDRDVLLSRWNSISGDLQNLTTHFSTEKIPATIKGRYATYVNQIGASKKTLSKYVDRVDSALANIVGWRSTAMNDLKVLIAGPATFGGTAGGKYSAEKDALFVRGTPAILKRNAGGYGSLDYIITHELGHRYERQHYMAIDFDQLAWYTTHYSRKEGFGGSEAFAELFALGVFPSIVKDSRGTWDKEIQQRFEKLMEGQYNA